MRWLASNNYKWQIVCDHHKHYLNARRWICFLSIMAWWMNVTRPGLHRAVTIRRTGRVAAVMKSLSVTLGGDSHRLNVAGCICRWVHMKKESVLSETAQQRVSLWTLVCGGDVLTVKARANDSHHFHMHHSEHTPQPSAAFFELQLVTCQTVDYTQTVSAQHVN